MTEYICGICGARVTDLDTYLKHVAECGAKAKKAADDEAKQKYLEEVNAAISKVKAAKAYYNECLTDFKAKYPKEYEMNFAPKKTVSKAIAADKADKTLSDIETYEFLHMLSDLWNMCDE